MIPEATYPARAVEYELGISDNGTEQIGVSFRIAKGEYEGSTLTWYGFFNTPDNAQRAIKSLRACGWKGDDVTKLDGITDNEVSIVVEVDEYQGKLQNKVAWVNGAGVAMKNVMNDAQKRAFAVRMKSLATASRGNAPSTRAVPPRQDRQAPQRPPPEMGDERSSGGFGDPSDEIPF